METLRNLVGEKETRIALQDRELSLRDAKIGELEAELTKKVSPRPQAEPRERRKKSPQP